MGENKAAIFCCFCILVLFASLSACGSPARGQAATSTATAAPSSTDTHTKPPADTATATLLPGIHLSELTPEAAQVGAGSLGVGIYRLPDDGGHNGNPIVTHGKAYPDGLLAHAPSQVEYRLDGKYRLFRTDILKQEDVRCGDGVIFKVDLDGSEVYASPVIDSWDMPQAIELDVTGAQALLLVVDQNQTVDCDWSIWGDPLLVPLGGVAADYPTATLRPTETPDPNLPCGGSAPERIYLFLDCNDIRRIRMNVQSGDPDFLRAWAFLQASVDNYRRNFPTAYNPDYSYPVLWWGSANYIPRDMALVYLVSGDMQVGRDVERLLDLVYANTPKTHFLVNFEAPTASSDRYAGGLLSHPRYGEGVFQSTLFAYLAIRDSSMMDEAKRQQYDEFFINQAHLLEEAAIIKGNTIPVDSWINRNNPLGENVAAATLALAFPEDKGVQQVYQRVMTHLDWQLANWWRADGGWGEDTNGYGHRVFEGMLIYAESLLKNTGMNIFETDFGGHSIHTMCTYFLQSLTPEGDPPQINDTLWGFFDPGTLMLCAQRTGDPELNFAANQALRGLFSGYHNTNLVFTPFETIAWWNPALVKIAEPPDWTSALLPSSGLGIFRSDWTPEAQYGLLKYTTSRVHAHFSFGEFFLNDHGPWLTGNGYHLGPEYDRSVNTTSASTLTLDNSRQATLGGKLVAFEALGQTGYMAVTSQSYPSLAHTRHVFWNRAGHQWIVVDDAALNASSAGHKLQVRWYVRGVEFDQPGAGNWVFTRRDDPGYLSIQMPSAAPASYSAIQRVFDPAGIGDANGVQIEVMPARATRILSVLTYSADKPGATPSLSRDDSEQGLRVTSQPEAGSPTWDWLLPALGRDNYERSDYSLQAEAACVWKQAANVAGYCLYTGTSLTADGLLLAESSAPLSLEVDFDGRQIQVDTASDAILHLYWPATIQSLNEGESSVDFDLGADLLTLELAAGKHVLTVLP